MFSSSIPFHFAKDFHPLPASNPLLFKSLQNFKETMTNIIVRKASLLEQPKSFKTFHQKEQKTAPKSAGKEATRAGIFSLSTKHQLSKASDI